MHITLIENYQCLKCGCRQEPEKVFRQDKFFLRCIECKHESLKSVTTSSQNGDDRWTRWFRS
jgi:hypothetical protein